MKEIKTAAELDLLIQQAVQGIEHVADAHSTSAATDMQVGHAYWHEPDDGARNWNVTQGRNTGPFTGAIEKVVNGLRDRFDMKNPAA